VGGYPEKLLSFSHGKKQSPDCIMSFREIIIIGHGMKLMIPNISERQDQTTPRRCRQP
jgi:hypothetical protein